MVPDRRRLSLATCWKRTRTLHALMFTSTVRRLLFANLIFLFLVSVLVNPVPKTLAQDPLTIALDTVISGLSNPVYVTHAGDASGRLFIVEQAGRILISQNGNLIGTPFLDIHTSVTSGGEMGLLSVAFHPDYKNNRRFFVNYTASRPNLKTIIAEYRASASNPNLADTTEKVILEIDQPFENHNGGQLQFGPDGYLYIGMGDGGSGGDPLGNGQNKSSLLGKLLRIDIDSSSSGYRVPPDNPFVNVAGADEVWAYGLRNPWRFSFDRANGRLFLADVGQNSFEEVDLVERGGNYGWNIMEGAHCFSPSTGCITTGLLLPINEYDHSLGEAVTGGYVYRGRQFPDLSGTYLFADFGSSRIWGLTETNRGAWIRSELLRPGFNISSFGEDEEGEIYVVNYGGGIHRIRVTGPPSNDNQRTLILSSAKSDRFTSLLFVVNRDSSPNEVAITSRRGDGSISGILNISLTPGGFFRNVDILGGLNLPMGSFGPLTVESSNNKMLSTVSEVRSIAGTAGFFAGQTQKTASTERVIAEVVDTGERGTSGSFRTNLGVNNVSSSQANVQVSLIDSNGLVLGTRSIQVPSQGMLQVNDIVRDILRSSSATGLHGYLKLTSDQPILAWASKIDNGTDDPSVEEAVGQEILETGIKLLIPSASGTNRFKTLLVVINREDVPNQIILTARNLNGDVIGTLSRDLPARGFFRSTDFLGEIGAPPGSFGPLTVESASGRLLTCISEIRSADGTAGFFPAVSAAGATLQRVVAEVVDSGDRGTPDTFRTNLGINNLGPVTAHVSLQLIGGSGNLLGTQTATVPLNGLTQINDIVQSILGAHAPTGINAYLKLISDQPIHAWASKINNATDDPSIIMGIP